MWFTVITRLKNSPKAIPLYMDFVGKMETPDKHTVVINMTEWIVSTGSIASVGGTMMPSRPRSRKKPRGAPGNGRMPRGTGPYMLTEYKEGHSQIYTKNPNYWDSETIGGKKYKLPFTDKIVMMIIKDEATQIASLRTGKIDLMMAMSWKNVAEPQEKQPPVAMVALALYQQFFLGPAHGSEAL